MAFSLAIDRAQLVQVACAGGITCSAADGGLITKGLKGYAGDGSDPLAKFDATQAKTLLKSGDPTGKKTANLTYYYDPNKAIYKATAENIQLRCRAHNQYAADKLYGRAFMDATRSGASQEHGAEVQANLS